MSIEDIGVYKMRADEQMWRLFTSTDIRWVHYFADALLKKNVFLLSPWSNHTIINTSQ